MQPDVIEHVSNMQRDLIGHVLNMQPDVITCECLFKSAITQFIKLCNLDITVTHLNMWPNVSNTR